MSSNEERRILRPQRIAVVVWTIAATLMLVLAPLEELVWAPLAMTDDSYDLPAIYSIFDGVTLSVGCIGIGIAFLLGVACIVTFAFLGYSGRARAHWALVSLLGSMLVWIGLLAMFFAGFGIGNAISDEIPPYVGVSSPVGYALQNLGIVSFLVTVLGLLASVVVGARSWFIRRRTVRVAESVECARR